MGEERKWEDLVMDCLVNVLGRVGVESLFADVPFVCKNWHEASLHLSCWKYLVFPDDWSSFADRLSARDICQFEGFSINRFMKFIINRSCKRATVLYIPGGCSPETFKYAADETPALRILRVSSSQLFDHKLNFMELFGKWKSLEDIVIDCSFRLLDILTAIRLNCKNLNSLRVNGGKIFADQSLAIVALLPNIKHLYLRGAYINRETLVIIILNGSREKLETLDVSDCGGFEVDEEILILASGIQTFKF